MSGFVWSGAAGEPVASQYGHHYCTRRTRPPPVTIARRDNRPIIDHALPLRVTMLKLRADQTRPHRRCHFTSDAWWFVVSEYQKHLCADLCPQPFTPTRERGTRAPYFSLRFHTWDTARTGERGAWPVTNRVRSGARAGGEMAQDHAMVISRSQTCRYGGTGRCDVAMRSNTQPTRPWTSLALPFDIAPPLSRSSHVESAELKGEVAYSAPRGRFNRFLRIRLPDTPERTCCMQKRAELQGGTGLL